MLRDGLNSKQIIQRLGEPVRHLRPNHFTNWRKHGYKRWLLEQARIDRMRTLSEMAIRIAKENEGAVIHQANLHAAASQIFEVLDDFDAKSLQERLDGDPQNYMRVVNGLARVSETALKFDRYRAEIAEKKEKMQRLIQESKESGGMTHEAIEELETMLKMM
jgi:hypothetical protein